MVSCMSGSRNCERGSSYMQRAYLYSYITQKLYYPETKSFNAFCIVISVLNTVTVPVNTSHVHTKIEVHFIGPALIVAIHVQSLYWPIGTSLLFL